MAPVQRPTFMSSHRQVQRRLTDAYGRLADMSDKVASNKNFRKPSESPVEAAHAALLQERLDHLEAVGRSVEDAMARLDVTDAKMLQASDLYSRIKQLTVQAADGTQSGAGREAIAQEVAQLRDSLIAVANSEYLGQPLFAGLTEGPAIEMSAGVWTYSGDAGQVIERRISPSESIRVNTTAAEMFQVGGTDLFTELDNLVVALGNDDIDGIQQANGLLDDFRSALSAAHAGIGAAANRVQVSLDRNSATASVVTSQLSLVRDIDLAEAITQQKMLESAYEAALGVTGRVGNLSLLDFLR